jgi:hypothetical protein
MRKVTAIILSVVLAAICTRPLLSLTERLVVPRGQTLLAISPLDPYQAMMRFALPLCACAGLAASVACYLRIYSVAIRCAITVLPMLLAGFYVAVLKAAQFERAVSMAGQFGMPPGFSWSGASLHTIPLAALAAGLSAVALAVCLRRPKGNQVGALDGSQAIRVSPAATQDPPSAK